METIVRGYQYSPESYHFTGVYDFPNNLDKEHIHLPPFTTLIPIPSNIPKGMAAFWENNNWVIKKDTITIEPDYPPVEDYELVMPGYIETLKSVGKWSDADETKYLEAQERIRQRTAQQQLEYQQFLDRQEDYKQKKLNNG